MKKSIFAFASLAFASLALALLSLPATAAPYSQPAFVTLGTSLSGQAANVRVTVTDASGTVQLAATNAPGGTAIAESTDAAGNATTGVYRCTLPLDTNWLPVRVKYTLVGSTGVVAENVFGGERAALATDGYTASLPGTVTSIKTKTDLIATNGMDSPNEVTAQSKAGIVTTNNDKTNYSGVATNFVAGPTAIQIRQEMDTNSTGFSTLLGRIPQAVLFDAGGYVKGAPQTPVTLASVQAFSNSVVPGWLGNTSVFLAAEQAKLLAASTAQQAGQPVTLPAAPTGYGGATLAQIQQLLPANFGLFSIDSTGGIKVVTLPTAPTGYGFTGLQTADISAVRDAILNAPLFPGESGFSLLNGWQDDWATAAAPATITYPDSTHQATVYKTPGNAGQHSTNLTTNNAGKPVSRNTTRP